MNFGQIKTKIETRIARTETTLINQIGGWVNERQRMICDYKNFWFLKVLRNSTLEEDEQDYLYPADASTIYKDDAILYLLNTTDNTQKILPMISFEEALKLYKPNETNKPEHWVANKSSFRLYPIPDDDYNISFLYYQFLQDLVSAGDTNVLTNEMPNILIEGALAEAFSYLQELGDAQYHERKYEALLKNLIIRDTDRKLPEEIQLVPSYNVHSTRYEK